MHGIKGNSNREREGGFYRWVEGMKRECWEERVSIVGIENNLLEMVNG
jgi:hypothetical protein